MNCYQHNTVNAYLQFRIQCFNNSPFLTVELQVHQCHNKWVTYVRSMKPEYLFIMKVVQKYT